MAKPFPHPHWNLRGGKGPTEVGAWTMPSHAWLLWAVAASCPRPNKLCGPPSLLPKQILELGYSSLFSLGLMKGSSLFPTVWGDTVRVLESPSDLSPEVALTQHGNAPGLTLGANTLDCEERTGVGCFCVPYGPQLADRACCFRILGS